MNKSRTERPLTRSFILLAILLSGLILMALPITQTTSAIASDEYKGPEFCGTCHNEIYAEWSKSGHPLILMPAEKARELGVHDPPPGVS